MSKRNEATRSDRRGFLKRTGIALGAAGAASVAATTETLAASPEEQATESGYRETDHVRKYYELARF